MIKTNELRQGNLLQCQFKVDGPMHIITITGVKDNFIAWTAKGCCPATFVFLNDSYKPIPLTEEWLKTFRFVIGEGPADGYYVGVNGARLKQLTGMGWSYFDYSNLLRTVKYVHKLQNMVFEMTGIELSSTL